MARSLSNLVNNLSEVIHRIKCKFGHYDKKCKTYRIKCNHCHYFLEYTNFEDNLREYKRLCSSKNYQHELDEKLNEKFLIHINFLTMIRISFVIVAKRRLSL